MLFMEPALVYLPEKRLQKVGKLAGQGILSGRAPFVARMAPGLARRNRAPWPMGERSRLGSCLHSDSLNNRPVCWGRILQVRRE